MPNLLSALVPDAIDATMMNSPAGSLVLWASGAFNNELHAQWYDNNTSKQLPLSELTVFDALSSIVDVSMCTYNDGARAFAAVRSSLARVAVCEADSLGASVWCARQLEFSSLPVATTISAVFEGTTAIETADGSM